MASPAGAGAVPRWDAGWPEVAGAMLPPPCTAFLWNSGKSTNSGFEVMGGGADAGFAEHFLKISLF